MRYVARTLGLVLLAAASSVAGAQATARITVAPTSKLWIEGTSNVHAWKCEAKTIDATIDIDALAAQLATASPKMLKKVSVKLPVSGLECGHGQMNKNLQKALKADQNADISYTMVSFEPALGEGNDFTLRMVGTLMVAGTEQSLSMEVTATRLPDGTIKATGAVPVKMTAFGVKPPSAMFGAIKTGDEVKVKFELTVGPRTVAAAFQKE